MSDEALRLLAAVKREIDADAHLKCLLCYGENGHYEDCPAPAIDAFLAQPEPAAREERHWPEVAWRVGVEDADFAEGVRVVVMPCCGFAFDAVHTDGHDAEAYTCPLCADTSSATVALLAQGERLKRFTQAVEQHDWLALIDIAGLANAGEDGLLVNYEVEGDYATDARYVWPKRMRLLMGAARAALAPREERDK